MPIARQIIEKLMARYQELDIVRKQIECTDFHKTANGKIYAVIAEDGAYANRVAFSFEQILGILNARRDGILAEIQALGGEGS